MLTSDRDVTRLAPLLPGMALVVAISVDFVRWSPGVGVVMIATSAAVGVYERRTTPATQGVELRNGQMLVLLACATSFLPAAWFLTYDHTNLDLYLAIWLPWALLSLTPLPARQPATFAAWCWTTAGLLLVLGVGLYPFGLFTSVPSLLLLVLAPAAVVRPARTNRAPRAVTSAGVAVACLILLGWMIALAIRGCELTGSNGPCDLLIKLKLG